VLEVSEVEQLMAIGAQHRTVANNNVNEHSSRSHLVLTISITKARPEGGGGGGSAGREPGGCGGVAWGGELNLIDLAGSERLGKTHAHGQRLKEAQNINKSLSALGDVIHALGEANGGRGGHVPYRNSKLTFLLQVTARAHPSRTAPNARPRRAARTRAGLSGNGHARRHRACDGRARTGRTYNGRARVGAA
jgi:kinesin family protein C2/C3